MRDLEREKYIEENYYLGFAMWVAEKCRPENAEVDTFLDAIIAFCFAEAIQHDYGYPEWKTEALRIVNTQYPFLLKSNIIFPILEDMRNTIKQLQSVKEKLYER